MASGGSKAGLLAWRACVLTGMGCTQPSRDEKSEDHWISESGDMVSLFSWSLNGYLFWGRYLSHSETQFSHLYLERVRPKVCETPMSSEHLYLCLRCMWRQKVLVAKPGKGEEGLEEAVPTSSTMLWNPSPFGSYASRVTVCFCKF